MANEIRSRTNNISGAINDNPLTNVATTINAPLFADLPVINTTNHLILILDPLEIYGAAEIVMVTAHTAAATSVTVIRGAEGTVARQHALGTVWFHGPVASDWTLQVTSGTRPSVPYEGEQIYETDTHRPVHRDNTQWLPGGGVSVVTSSTRPANPYVGQTIYESDTTTIYSWIGAAWHEVWAPDHAVRVRSSGAINVANATTVKVTFNITDWDRNSNWRDVTDDYLVARSGLYTISGMWYSTGGGNRIIPLIFINGALRSAGMFQSAVSSNEQSYPIYDEFELNVNDVVDLRVENTSGAGTATGGVASGHGFPRLTIRRTGPLIP